MARISAAVVCLLGLLACSALAQAQAADALKSDSRQNASQMAVEEQQLARDNDSFMRSKHAQIRESPKTDQNELKVASMPDNKDMPQVQPRALRKMPRHMQFDLEATHINFEYERPGKVGSNAVLSFDLERNGVKVGKAVLTGTATSVDKQTDKQTDKKTDSFELNSLMTIEAVGEEMKGTTLVAAGFIAWDGKKSMIVADHDTLTIVSGSGAMAGAQGIISLAGGEGAKESVSFDIVLPKNRRKVVAEVQEKKA